MIRNGAYTLSESVELLCISQGNSKLKGFKSYFAMSKLVWNELLARTLWAFSQKWLPVESDGVRNYILLPCDVSFFMSLQYEKDCEGMKKLVPLGISKFNSFIPKPAIKQCKCKKCNCGESCAAANSFTFSTKEHIIDNVSYLEKIWKEVCANGDIVEYREVPVQKFGADPLAYTIDWVKSEQRICKVEVKPCGCVAETPANKQILSEFCGCTFQCCPPTEIRTPETSGKLTIQFDGNKIILIGDLPTKEFLVTYQQTDAGDDSLVPEYALKALWKGITYYTTMNNPTYGPAEKRAEKNAYKSERLDLIEFLNPIDLEVINRLQDKQKQL